MEFGVGSVITHKASGRDFKVVSIQYSYGLHVGAVAILEPLIYKHTGNAAYDFSSLNYYFNKKEIPSNYKIV